MKILFQGDSVTDSGRLNDPNGMGDGYPFYVAAALKNKEHVTVINRGVSGNRTWDLKDRWQEDCIDLQPDILTILIGINDVWRKYDSNMETTAEQYRENYEYLLDRAKKETNAKIILMEPFVLPVTPDRREWRRELDPEIQVVRDMAKKYETPLVTLDGIFAKASIGGEYSDLCADGVHPTAKGHMLIAAAWLEETKTLIK